jgi:hypothetical protein
MNIKRERIGKANFITFTCSYFKIMIVSNMSKTCGRNISLYKVSPTSWNKIPILSIFL